MSKRATKRVKLVDASQPALPKRNKAKKEKRRAAVAIPLGDAEALLADDAAKDDEERRLEADLFGVPFAPTRSGLALDDDDDGDGDEEEDRRDGHEMENLLDTDVSVFLLVRGSS
jgi:hypothetical protein